jgi:hypothetical protein
MRAASCSLYMILALAFGIFADAQQGSQKGTPERAEVAAHAQVLEEPPMGPQTRKVDPVKIHAEAEELAKLAATVPNDIDQVAQGKLPKDLGEKLKRIEKLSKNLRGELTP